MNGLYLYNARLNGKSDAEVIPDVTEFNKPTPRGLACVYQVFGWQASIGENSGDQCNRQRGLVCQCDGDFLDELPNVLY